jgi:hypothetical protein
MAHIREELTFGAVAGFGRCLGLKQLSLRFLSMVDVSTGEQDAPHVLSLVQQWVDYHLQPEVVAIGFPAAKLDSGRVLGSYRTAE